MNSSSVELYSDWGEETKKPDEGWWAAILADEKNLQEDEEFNETINGDATRKTETKPAAALDWDLIQFVYNSDEIIRLTVTSYNRGGILVSGEGVQGFVPASHLINLPADCSESDREMCFEKYLGQQIAVKVIECEPARERLILSERAALAGEGRRNYLLSTLKENQIVEGKVTNATEFGVFVDLGGLEGLIHVSELSWGRVQCPGDILKAGEVVKTLILQIAEERGRIALSLKRLTENPWESILEVHHSGDIVPAFVTCVKNYGVFARLEEGVEGLIHVSSVDLPPNVSIEDYFFQGQEVLVRILHIEPEKRRLGLSLEMRK
ncbi:MAG: S1 RNA-binding domain-containing protein [Chloroflexota bacterium]